jgi:hypothetical protein
MAGVVAHQGVGLPALMKKQSLNDRGEGGGGVDAIFKLVCLGKQGASYVHTFEVGYCNTGDVI